MERDWVAEGLPGEFGGHPALVLGLHYILAWCPDVLLSIARALLGHVSLVGIVGNEAQRRIVVTLLSDWDLPAGLMEFVCMPVSSIWVRDYGPGFVRMSRGNVAMVDAGYTLGNRPNDDCVPLALANLFGLPVIQAPLILEGGNLLSNGKGFGLTSLKLYEQNQARGLGPSDVEAILTTYYGMREGATLTPLIGESTRHIDMFATFVAPDTVVVGQYDPHVDPENASVLDENANLLAGRPTAAGPLKVVRIPMPTHQDGIFRTYTNVAFANGRLLMPSYPGIDPHLEDQAAATYARLLPGWKIIRVDCSALMRHGQGALHCMMLNIPWLTDRYPSPPLKQVPRRRRSIVLWPDSATTASSGV